MMLFDSTNDDDNIVIVPPKPDSMLSHNDEFSYSNLYCYDGSSAATTATTPAATASNNVGAPIETRAETLLPKTATSSDNRKKQESKSKKATLKNESSQQKHDSPETEVTDATLITRNPANGAFTFQVHAEYDLLMHVQRDLDKHRSILGNSDIQLSKLITQSVDEYCLGKQWMYHIGSEKGVAIGRFLREAAERWYAKMIKEHVNGGEVEKFICVDLGTYCGYSALVLASTLRQFAHELRQQHVAHELRQQHEQAILEQEGIASPPPFQFHIYTTEVSDKLANVAQSIFRLAKMDQFITPILTKQQSSNEKYISLSQILQGPEDSPILPNQQIDFLLLDHAKHLYLNDVQDLERSKMIKAGSYVTADNVVFNRLDEYRDHMHRMGLEGVVESRLEEMNLEYSNNLKDGVEMTVYLKDPCVTKN